MILKEHVNYAHNTVYDIDKAKSPLTQTSIDIAYADQLASNIWSKPREESPSMYTPREGEWFVNPKLRHTLELNSPAVPYAGHHHPRNQTKWEDDPTTPPEINKEKRERYPVVLSSMTKYVHVSLSFFQTFSINVYFSMSRYVEEMNTMEFGFKLY